MPEVNGYQLIRQIRNLKSPVALIPAIALSAYAADSDRQKSITAGFERYLSKPVKIGNLLEAIAELI